MIRQRTVIDGSAANAQGHQSRGYSDYDYLYVTVCCQSYNPTTTSRKPAFQYGTKREAGLISSTMSPSANDNFEKASIPIGNKERSRFGLKHNVTQRIQRMAQCCARDAHNVVYVMITMYRMYLFIHTTLPLTLPLPAYIELIKSRGKYSLHLPKTSLSSPLTLPSLYNNNINYLMATIAIGESLDSKEQQQQQEQQLEQHQGHESQNSISNFSCDKQYYDYDPKSGFCSHTGIYCSRFKLGPHHVIPSKHNLDVASFVLLKLPPQHISETKIALIDSATGSSLTYSQLKHSALSLAATLHHGLGLCNGDVVLLLLSPNTILYPAICLGILASGAIITPADPLSTCADVTKQVHETGAKIAICAPEEAHKVEATGIPVLMTSTCAQRPHTGLWPLLTVEELMQRGDPLEAPLGMGATQSDMAALLYSSSSTGKSKGIGKLVTLTHGKLISMSMIMKWRVETESLLAAPVAAAAGDQDDVFLCLLPMSYAFLGLGLLCVGSTTVVMSGRFDATEMMGAVLKYRITNIINMAVPPPVLLSAMNHNGSGRNLSLLRRVSTMGSNARGAVRGSRVGKEFKRRFPWVVLREGYGNGRMSGVLCGPTTVFASEKEARDGGGSVGQLLPQLEGRVVEVKSGRAVGPGAVGELWLRGPPVIKEGYSGVAEKDTTATVTPAEGGDGWLRTGDLAYFDKDGFLYIVDGIKDRTKHNNGHHQVRQVNLHISTHSSYNEHFYLCYKNKV